MVVRVPATSANMGPGFDAMGLALSMHAEVGICGVDPMPERAAEAGDGHPAQVAFERAGGHGRVWVANTIPMGRGLGFSGAVRVGGIVAAEVQVGAGEWSMSRSRAVAIGAELEGHADNVAPSLHGGIVVTSGDTVVRVPLAVDAAFVVWIPDTTTSTNESRAHIGPAVPLADAVYNIAHAAMLVAALTTGDVGLLREATGDRIHQDARFAKQPASRAALDAGLAAGAWCGWLSGSGPTVAMMCEPGGAASLAAALPANGHTKVLGLDTAGTVVV